jgi:hypothetical protein
MFRRMRLLFVICSVGAAGVLVGASSSIADTGSGTKQTSTAPTVPRTTPSPTVAPTIDLPSVLAPSTRASSLAGPADSHGCPSYDGCGWVNSNFGDDGAIFNQDSNFTQDYEPECNVIVAYEDWNDCVSSIDNTETTGCYETWFWNINYGSTRWVEAPGVAHGTLGSSNDNFSSSKYCTNSAGN